MKNNPILLLDMIAASLRGCGGLTRASEIASEVGADDFAVYDELLRLVKRGEAQRFSTRTMPSRRFQMMHDTFSARAR